jgi:hypothetical protein
MRRFLITLAILVGFIAAGCATWIFGGRQLSLFIDRYKTIEIASSRINSIAYEGGGTAGILTVNDLRLSLNDVSPKISLSIGSTKDNQFALASGGKVFAFGPLASAGENAGYDLATVPQAGDDAVFETRRSAVSWPTPFDLNLMTGQSPSWKRHLYYRLRWKKPSGATLEMLWRYEQYFYSATGWGSGFMTHQGATGLIQVEIHL